MLFIKKLLKCNKFRKKWWKSLEKFHRKDKKKFSLVQFSIPTEFPVDTILLAQQVSYKTKFHTIFLFIILFFSMKTFHTFHQIHCFFLHNLFCYKKTAETIKNHKVFFLNLGSFIKKVFFSVLLLLCVCIGKAVEQKLFDVVKLLLNFQ